jgi:multisubunit Na+/H+ antiporter MnhC subunit
MFVSRPLYPQAQVPQKFPLTSLVVSMAVMAFWFGILVSGWAPVVHFAR